MNSIPAKSAYLLLSIYMSMSPLVHAKGPDRSPEYPRVQTDANSESCQNQGHGPLTNADYRCNVPKLGAALNFTEDRQLALDARILVSTDSKDSLERNGPWLNDKGLSSNAHVLIYRIEESARHGLHPEHYQLTSLIAQRTQLQKLQMNPNAGKALLQTLRTSLSSSLDEAFIDFATDLGQGLVNGRKLQRRLYRDAPLVDTGALLDDLANGKNDVASTLRSLIPSDDDYTALTRYMDKLFKEQRSRIERIQIPESARLKIGQHDHAIFKAKKRLIQIGDLSKNTVITPRFDADLELALKGVQSRHGLEPSGELNKRTRQALNLSLDDEIDRVAMSLERLRWLPRYRGNRHILVNLPAYELELRDNGKVITDMAVVIGSKRFPSASFSRPMSHIEFNPTWTVPTSITENELLEKEIEEPGYLRERNFHYLLEIDGRLQKVDYDSVTQEELLERPFRYRLRQAGGEKNALGRMKFMLPNPYSIYLHDTPAKHLFVNTDRAYSHGCIRLSDPELLARTLLKLDAKPEKDINYLLNTKRNRRSNLSEHVQTHLIYVTSWVGKDGRLHHAPDVYKYDPALKEALGKLKTKALRLAEQNAQKLIKDKGAYTGTVADAEES